MFNVELTIQKPNGDFVKIDYTALHRTEESHFSIVRFAKDQLDRWDGGNLKIEIVDYRVSNVDNT